MPILAFAYKPDQFPYCDLVGRIEIAFEFDYANHFSVLSGDSVIWSWRT